MHTEVPINITRSGEAALGFTISLSCSVNSNFYIDQPLLLWRAPSGVVIINSTVFTAVSGGGVSSRLQLHLMLVATSDAGLYSCEVKGESSGHQIASSKDYSITLHSEF